MEKPKPTFARQTSLKEKVRALNYNHLVLLLKIYLNRQISRTMNLTQDVNYSYIYIISYMYRFLHYWRYFLAWCHVRWHRFTASWIRFHLLAILRTQYLMYRILYIFILHVVFFCILLCLYSDYNRHGQFHWKPLIFLSISKFLNHYMNTNNDIPQFPEDRSFYFCVKCRNGLSKTAKMLCLPPLTTSPASAGIHIEEIPFCCDASEAGLMSPPLTYSRRSVQKTWPGILANLHVGQVYTLWHCFQRNYGAFYWLLYHPRITHCILHVIPPAVSLFACKLNTVYTDFAVTSVYAAINWLINLWGSMKCPYK